MRCSLSAADLAARRDHLEATLLPAVIRRRRLADGMAFELPRSHLDEARRFVAAERRCCDFADFAIVELGEMVAVEIRGRDARSARAIRRLFRPRRRWPWIAAGLGAAAVVVCELPLIIAAVAALMALLLGAG
jgi:hypothetical protein